MLLSNGNYCKRNKQDKGSNVRVDVRDVLGRLHGCTEAWWLVPRVISGNVDAQVLVSTFFFGDTKN